jgi:hypothetical protein
MAGAKGVATLVTDVIRDDQETDYGRGLVLRAASRAVVLPIPWHATLDTDAGFAIAIDGIRLPGP